MHAPTGQQSTTLLVSSGLDWCMCPLLVVSTNLNTISSSHIMEIKTYLKHKALATNVRNKNTSLKSAIKSQQTKQHPYNQDCANIYSSIRICWNHFTSQRSNLFCPKPWMAMDFGYRQRCDRNLCVSFTQRMLWKQKNLNAIHVLKGW